MCYSAQVWADYRLYVRQYGAELDIKEFYELFWRRSSDSKIKIPKAMEAAFAQPETDAQRRIKASIDTFAAAETVLLEQGLFEQRKRFADAERTLQTKITLQGAQRMEIGSRDRVCVDLRGIRDTVRTAARARQIAVAAFAREALVEAIGRPSALPEVTVADFGRAEIVKLTLRLRWRDPQGLRHTRAA